MLRQMLISVINDSSGGSNDSDIAGIKAFLIINDFLLHLLFKSSFLLLIHIKTYILIKSMSLPLLLLLFHCSFVKFSLFYIYYAYTR